MVAPIYNYLPPDFLFGYPYIPGEAYGGGGGPLAPSQMTIPISGPSQNWVNQNFPPIGGVPTTMPGGGEIPNLGGYVPPGVATPPEVKPIFQETGDMPIIHVSTTPEGGLNPKLPPAPIPGGAGDWGEWNPIPGVPNFPIDVERPMPKEESKPKPPESPLPVVVPPPPEPEIRHYFPSVPRTEPNVRSAPPVVTPPPIPGVPNFDITHVENLPRTTPGVRTPPTVLPPPVVAPPTIPDIPIPIFPPTAPPPATPPGGGTKPGIPPLPKLGGPLSAGSGAPLPDTNYPMVGGGPPIQSVFQVMPYMPQQPLTLGQILSRR